MQRKKMIAIFGAIALVGVAGGAWIETSTSLFAPSGGVATVHSPATPVMSVTGSANGLVPGGNSLFDLYATNHTGQKQVITSLDFVTTKSSNPGCKPAYLPTMSWQGQVPVAAHVTHGFAIPIALDAISPNACQNNHFTVKVTFTTATAAQAARQAQLAKQAKHTAGKP